MDHSVGEYLADLAQQNSNRRLVIVEAGPDPDTALAIVKLSFILKKHPAVQFKAIVEDWNLQRIVRELY